MSKLETAGDNVKPTEFIGQSSGCDLHVNVL